MFLKHLINPKPTIILFFVVFCVVFISIPLINYDFNTIFINSNTPSYLVFFLGLTLPFFQGLGLNNLVYEKNIIRKDNLVIGFSYYDGQMDDYRLGLWAADKVKKYKNFTLLENT